VGIGSFVVYALYSAGQWRAQPHVSTHLQQSAGWLLNRDLLAFLERLKSAHIHYVPADPTEDAVMVQIAVPGERWEVEFHGDGGVSVEVFTSKDGVRGAETLESLFRQFSD
jgi:hypothetical protein